MATFFVVGGDGEIDAVIAHGSQPAPAQLVEEVHSWEARLRGVDPLAPTKIAQLPSRVATLADVGGVQRALLDKGWVRGTYELIGVINDVRMLIRDGDRLVAGIALWRRLQWRTCTDAELRRLAAMQPLIELAYVSCLRTATGIDARQLHTLTPRQREVARLLARGATTPDVARALFISRETAKSHAQAVFEKLGVGSRRELIQHLKQSRDRDASRPPQRRVPIAPPDRSGASEPAIRLEGERESRRLLEHVLEWSAERVDAATGGCALLSARGDLACDAWGIARSGLPERIVRNLHRRLLPQPPAAIVEYLDANPWHAAVLEPDRSWPLAVDELRELTAHASLTLPLVTVLRRHGHVAGLIWLCRDADSLLDQGQSARELRRVHPLLELTTVPRGADARPRVSTGDDLAELGLSDRELAVARMALAGESNAAIARRLSISQSTVKKHVGRVLAKTGVRSRTQLLALLGDRP